MSKKHKDKVAKLPCCLCGNHGVQLHHIRTECGISQRQDDMLVIPLCPDCHTGPLGVHGDKTMLRIKKWSELDCLVDTLRRLYG